MASKITGLERVMEFIESGETAGRLMVDGRLNKPIKPLKLPTEV
ncbi:MAG: hypothetical protein QXW60_07725 [Nitrososphaerota archaeon]